jgi:hypothetical protein
MRLAHTWLTWSSLVFSSHNRCGLRYRSKQREQTSRGQSGNVPVSLLLNPESNKKGRTNINNPMIWETKLASFPASSQDHQQQLHVRLE